MQIRDVVWIFSARRANQNKNRQSSLKQIDGKILGALYLFSFTPENTKHKKKNLMALLTFPRNLSNFAGRHLNFVVFSCVTWETHKNIIF